ncbi:type IIL restriction-modification enzyme MmeI [Corynebacterium sp. UMB2355A]|uniref:type IIL restriction-modification enzyme MmeI n=1 Tax=Corynebacterium sp. UMB2355A TaxID=3081222 RepID=UPI0029FF3CE6|nr:type IIL restriction-modification enzyme MmeI [Corynebacterium sp. UMB2355A]WPJ92526.1 type IIL restriction-modification enzyme MmeI [Corynebacterium sp. UMB2355A]
MPPATTETTLSRDEIIQRLSEFRHYWTQQIEFWEQEGTRGTEKRYADSFLRELVECFGIKATRALEAQRPANRADTDSNLKGAIDMFYPGVVLAEAKSHYVALDDAQQQARAYLYGGDIDPDEKPRVLLMTNFKQFRLEFVDSVEPDYEFDLVDIAENVDALMFLHRLDAPTPKQQEHASVEASDSWRTFTPPWLGMSLMWRLAMMRLSAQKMRTVTRLRCLCFCHASCFCCSRKTLN